MNGPTRAFVLAAGLGTRLRPLTEERPKPLIEVAGRPLLVHALQLLADVGITDVALNSHWRHPALRATLGDAIEVDARPMRLHYTHEPEVLGTGGGLQGLRARLPIADDERVIVANGDALIDLDVRAFVTPPPAAVLSRLVLKQVQDVARYGAIGTDADDDVVTFAGRIAPRGQVARERMFCGWHLMAGRTLGVLPSVRLSPGVEDDTPVVRGAESCINKEGYPRWLRDGARVQGFDHPGFFLDVGTPERLWEANRAILTGEQVLHHLRPLDRFAERGPRLFVHPTARVDPTATLRGPCLIDADAEVGAGAVVGPLAVLGPRTVVAPGVRVERAVVQSTPAGRTTVDVDAVGVHVGAGLRCPIA